jgi:hypothetical protein
MTDSAPRRVRVSADDGRPRTPAARLSPARLPARTAGAAGVDAAGDDVDTVYSTALRRSQLRLALGTVSGFVVMTVALTIALTGIPELDHVVLGGVPLSWLLHAFAFYPMIFVFAVLYARAATRNEQRYRRLRERE